MSIRLVPTDGGDPLVIGKDLSIVGRGEDCDVRLLHKSISKMHCALARAEGMLLVRDLGSTNGTRVNGQRVRRAAVLPNDQLHVASVKFRVEVTDDSRIPGGNTERLTPDEVSKLMRDSGRRGKLEEFEGPPVQQNILPDVYEEGKPPKPDSSVE